MHVHCNVTFTFYLGRDSNVKELKFVRLPLFVSSQLPKYSSHH